MHSSRPADWFYQVYVLLINMPAIPFRAPGQAEQWGSVKAKKQPKPAGASSEQAAAGLDSTAAATHPPTRGGLGGRGRGRGGECPFA